MAHACLVREHVVLLFRRLNESRELDTRWGGEGRVADGVGEKQIAKKCSDFTFLCRGIFHLRQFGRRMTLRRSIRKIIYQIGNTLFRDCTRVLLSPSGVSEET